MTDVYPLGSLFQKADGTVERIKTITVCETTNPETGEYKFVEVDAEEYISNRVKSRSQSQSDHHPAISTGPVPLGSCYTKDDGTVERMTHMYNIVRNPDTGNYRTEWVPISSVLNNA